MHAWISRLCAILFAFLSGSIQPTYAQTDQAVLEFLNGINDKISLFSLGGNENRTGEFCVTVIGSFFDFGAMARVTSVGTWDRMNPNQQRAYRVAFLGRVRRDCVYRNSDFSREPLTFVGTREGLGGDRLIATQASKEGQPGRTIVWRTRPDSKGRLRGVDLIVDGRSLAITARDEAKAILDHGDGNIDVLIKSLEP
jgi:ABC-type transporter MlaC component